MTQLMPLRCSAATPSGLASHILAPGTVDRVGIRVQAVDIERHRAGETPFKVGRRVVKVQRVQARRGEAGHDGGLLGRQAPAGWRSRTLAPDCKVQQHARHPNEIALPTRPRRHIPAARPIAGGFALRREASSPIAAPATDTPACDDRQGGYRQQVHVAPGLHERGCRQKQPR